MCTKEKLQIVLGHVKEAAQRLYGDKLAEIFLYGSHARGDSTEDSDIDIMILLHVNAKEIKSWRGDTAEMASDLSLEHDVFLSIALRDRENFERNKDFLPFYQNIAREGIMIYG